MRDVDFRARRLLLRLWAGRALGLTPTGPTPTGGRVVQEARACLFTPPE